MEPRATGSELRERVEAEAPVPILGGQECGGLLFLFYLKFFLKILFIYF